jgi:hypothetical protein
VVSQELSAIPLLHASLSLSRTWERIKLQGLRAQGHTYKLNTSTWDTLLGRHSYVFLKPAATRENYGLGKFLLVHPRVLRREGVHCLLDDPSDWLRELKNCLSFGRVEFVENVDRWIRDDRLAQLLVGVASKHDISDDALWCEAMIDALMQSDALPRYYQEQQLSPPDFYQLLARLCSELGYSTSDYVNRASTEWRHTEEICVPTCVEPSDILGLRSGNDWQPLAKESPDEVGLDFFLTCHRRQLDNI